MENASKALIIAGAILLSILIIGLGMLIFNQARDAIGNTGMSAQEVSQYNADFISYEGTKTGSEVRRLIENIITHNRTVGADDTALQIGVINKSSSIPNGGAAGTEKKDDPDLEVKNEELSNVKKGISTGRTYTVSFNKDKNLRIIGIVIEEKK